MVSTSYPSDLKDWRGLFIRHLGDALARRADIKLRLWAPPGEHHPAAQSVATKEESAWLAELMAQGGIAHQLRRGGLRGGMKALRLLKLLRNAYVRNSDIDIHHINWLQNALPLPNDGRPLLTSVLGTDMQLLKLPLVVPLLRRVFRQRRTAICPNAEWMVPELEQHFGDVATIRFVPFGIAPGWFAIERTLAEQAQPKWLAVTRLTRAKLGPLFDWCAPLFRDQARELHLFGPMQEQLDLPEWVHYHGPASPETLMSEWFPQAHGLITLSQHAEGRPQVMLEAMAAGLPIIASDLPAHRNIVFEGQTGHLCETPASVGAAIASLEVESENRCKGDAARDWVAREIGTWDDCAERYAAVYRQLLEGTRA